MADPLLVDITTANICGNPLRLKRFVKRRMRRALSRHGVVFGQEIARSNRWRRDNYNRMWRAVAAVFNKKTFGGPHEVPISVPKGWTILGADVVQVHGGKRGVSPARYITTVRASVGGRKVAFVNCHPVSKPRPGVPYSRWRMDRWDVYHAELVAIVAELHAQGYTVIFGGDMNKPVNRMPQVHPDQIRLVGSGLDGLWCVPAPATEPHPAVEVRVVRRSKVARTALMDHPILAATVELKDAA